MYRPVHFAAPPDHPLFFLPRRKEEKRGDGPVHEPGIEPGEKRPRQKIGDTRAKQNAPRQYSQNNIVKRKTHVLGRYSFLDIHTVWGHHPLPGIYTVWGQKS